MMARRRSVMKEKKTIEIRNTQKRIQFISFFFTNDTVTVYKKGRKASAVQQK